MWGGDNQMESSSQADDKITEATLRRTYFLTVAQTTPHYDKLKRLQLIFLDSSWKLEKDLEFSHDYGIPHVALTSGYSDFTQVGAM